MGGSAFSAGDRPLHTPRMPKPVYEQVKRRCMAILRESFSCVACPIEGPGKQDFGDIDILVAWPKKDITSTRDSLRAMGEALGAARIIINEAASSNLALPWPRSPATELDSTNADGDESQEKYIQVDLRICKTLEEMQWMLFKHAHGDIWNILGSTIRPYGLTVDDGAMWLRVPEIENTNRNRAKVFLTSEPAKVLSFLGLPIGGYWDRPFESLDAMFEYAARCRMMYVPPRDPSSSSNDGGGGGADDEPPASSSTGGRQAAAEEDRRRLKSNDRRRMKGRPAFRAWIDDFIPACRQAGRFSDAPPRTTRERITEEALDAFRARDEFDARRDAFLQDRQRETIWNTLIKGAAPEPDRATATGAAVTYRACLVKALKRIVLEGDDSYGVRYEHAFRDDRGFWRFDRVVDFIDRYKDRVGEAAYERQHGRYMEHLKAKKLKAEGGQRS
ncbi:Acetolactate synthase [Purpureocillium lavendulum]|uniref:Acetolactate synthase n=1 Tax=Purpureocillium lavendulum TaxID=1247861 RepID=A0AB34G3B5_9HYPO|nr:Acetolactate synthase [Purpureocillium lavendulum]